MAFVMEALTPAHYEQIHRDHHALISQYCIPQDKWDPSWQHKRRAVDADCGIGLMLIDRFAPNDAAERYLLTCGDAALVFEMTGDDVAPIDWPDTLAARRGELQRAIAQALQVHGIYGLKAPRPFDIPAPNFK